LGSILSSIDQTSSDSFTRRLAVLSASSVAATLPGIRHGIEREALRINQGGGLAQTPHGDKLGSALTHEFITTDFSESLLEFITPPESDPDVTIAQLADVHKYVLSNIGEERLWPMSMPCYIDCEDQIPIAKFGCSNIGKMKTLYRVGLKNRYGSMMQAIAGVHFNFSLPEDFWQAWLLKTENIQADKDSISSAYFALIRNYRRFCWLIPYLYGSSPALCSSFIKGKKTSMDFKKLGKGTQYLPYATSLRMSDLGYTSSAQSGLAVCYNKVDSYIASLRAAISTPSEEYQKFAAKKDGEYQQLNSNVLQIENELYSPIRPKQPTKTLEKPTDALKERGVSYVEVRALDVNPFSPIGIERNQFFFLDVFLLYCLVAPSEFMDPAGHNQTEQNLRAVVDHGRAPDVMLQDGEQVKSLPRWAEEIFASMGQIAKVLDDANGNKEYSAAVETEWLKILDPNLTPSAKVLNILLEQKQDNGSLGLFLAEGYKKELLAGPYRQTSEKELRHHASESIQRQVKLEKEDTIGFDEFLFNYFDYSADEATKDKSCA
jgi:glutamate--cysteine ligase